MPDPRRTLLNAIQAANNPRLVAIEAAAVQQVEGVAEAPVQEVRDERVHIPEVIE